MDAYLTEEERQLGNRRNGKMQKQVQTPLGEVTVSTTRDRNSSFEPQFIKKREIILAEGVADRIIGLYALGNSTREISDWMEENLGNRVSAETISSITDRVLPEIKACVPVSLMMFIRQSRWTLSIIKSLTREGVPFPRNLQRLRYRQGRAQGFAWNVYL